MIRSWLVSVFVHVENRIMVFKGLMLRSKGWLRLQPHSSFSLLHRHQPIQEHSKSRWSILDRHQPMQHQSLKPMLNWETTSNLDLPDLELPAQPASSQERILLRGWSQLSIACSNGRTQNARIEIHFLIPQIPSMALLVLICRLPVHQC